MLGFNASIDTPTRTQSLSLSGETRMGKMWAPKVCEIHRQRDFLLIAHAAWPRIKRLHSSLGWERSAKWEEAPHKIINIILFADGIIIVCRNFPTISGCFFLARMLIRQRVQRKVPLNQCLSTGRSLRNCYSSPTSPEKPIFPSKLKHFSLLAFFLRPHLLASVYTYELYEVIQWIFRHLWIFRL